MDLRCHGDSPMVNEPATMRDFAMDVYDTLSTHNIPIDIVVGHSFGGKVAMELMNLYSLNLPSLPKTAIILDISCSPHTLLSSLYSMIGNISDEAALSHIDSVIDAIDGVQRPIPNYTHLKKELLRQGLQPAIADWLSTSVR